MITLKGTVTSGLNKAREFIKKEHYKKQYLNKIGFMPYEGTLNIKLLKSIEIDLKQEYSSKLKKIEGNSELGDVYFLYATIVSMESSSSCDVAILFPTKTIYNSNILEIVSPEKLRDTMNLKDESEVILKI